MSKNTESLGVLFALVVIIILITPYIPYGPSDGVVNPFSCRKIEGAVVLKEHDKEGHKLYVEYFVADEWEGSIVYVSNNTYHAFEEGDTYEQIVCDIFEYENILQQIEDLQNIGILIPHNG